MALSSFYLFLYLRLLLDFLLGRTKKSFQVLSILRGTRASLREQHSHANTRTNALPLGRRLRHDRRCTTLLLLAIVVDGKQSGRCIPLR